MRPDKDDFLPPASRVKGHAVKRFRHGKAKWRGLPAQLGELLRLIDQAGAAGIRVEGLMEMTGDSEASIVRRCRGLRSRGLVVEVEQSAGVAGEPAGCVWRSASMPPRREGGAS
jgi:hypothetical protein